MKQIFCRTCGKNRKCTLKADHCGRCNKERKFHPFWRKTMKTKLCERKGVDSQIKDLEDKARNLQEKTTQQGFL